MASLSTCHLGLWLGWQILLNLVKYETAVITLRNNFGPKRSVMMERFRQRAQRPGESVREYITALHELVANCNFGQLSDELIRDQLIEKTNNPRVRERLLMEPDTLTLEKAIALASRIEVAVNESLSIKNSETRSTDSTKFETPRVQTVRAKSPYSAAKLNRSTHTATNTRVQLQAQCGNCGYSSHVTGSAKCPAMAKTCRLCPKMNHFASVADLPERGVPSVKYNNQMNLHNLYSR